jgi:hypothetical protein
MSKRVFALLCLLALMATTAMADGPTINIDPPSATLPPGSTQLFTASSCGTRPAFHQTR